ncbi:MAG: patatin-like phospholipase family protein, partial [Varibaculum cambriense]|nr:patatin-like phospholipase family protein [Varibaculum cambriense]
MQQFENNILDTALLLEGGGMRGSYTAGAINMLLEAEIHLNYVAGISAGATNLVNYLARLPQRSKRCFVDISSDPDFGGWKTVLKGKGIFDTHHMYYDMT